MMTPHHLVFNSALGKRFLPHWPLRAVLAGALFPDIWVWLFFIWQHLILGVPQDYLWQELYFRSAWNGVFCLAHSLWLLPLCVAISWWRRNTGLAALAFFSSALFHAVCDFLVHHHDAYRNFYPFSDWRFESPVSYWETAYYGWPFSLAESGVSILCLLYWHRLLATGNARHWIKGLIGLDAILLLLTLLNYTQMHLHGG